MRTNRNNIIKLFAFILIGAILLTFISNVLERKTYIGPWNYMAKLNEFYSQPNDSIEYICVGSSHAYCTINPLEVWNNSGIKGFVLATQQQPLEATYHYINEAFKTQSPKVVILESLMVISDTHTEAVIYDAVDPLKSSLNKIQMINSLVEKEDRNQYYFNIIKYHTRWKELTKNDIIHVFDPPIDSYKGFVSLNGTCDATNQIPDYASIEEIAISPKNMETLDRIHQLVKDHNAELVIMIGPYDVESHGGLIKSAKIWAETKGIDIIDYTLMLDDLGIDPNYDYYDSSHFNNNGAKKVSKHLSAYLSYKGLKADKNDKNWNQDYQTYLDYAQN